MKEKHAIAIYFSKEESELLQEADKYTTVTEPALIRVLMKERLKEVEEQGTFIKFRFDLRKRTDNKIYKTKIVRFDESDYKRIKRICDSTTITPSNLIKYWIMPELKKIVSNKKWEGII